MEATLGSLRTVGLWIRDATRDGGVPYEVAFGLDLAVHEAVENVVRHGRPDGAAPHLRLRFRSDERVEVVIVDDGRAFDPLSVPAPTVPQRIEEVIPGGQGVHLMRHFTDEVRYRREGERTSSPSPGPSPPVRERRATSTPWPEAPSSRASARTSSRPSAARAAS